MHTAPIHACIYIYISPFDRATSFHEREEDRSRTAGAKREPRRRREGSGCFTGKIYNPTDRLQAEGFRELLCLIRNRGMHTSTHLQPRLFLLALVRTPFTRARVYASIFLYTNVGLYPPRQRLKNHGLLRFCSRTFFSRHRFSSGKRGSRVSRREREKKSYFKYKPIRENFSAHDESIRFKT